jgi:hypothetical protein
MRGIDLAKKVFELKNYYGNNSKQQIAERVSQQENEVFRDYCFPLLPKPMKVLRT